MATTTIKMPGTPTPWMNAAVRVMLRTPGLRRVFGKMFAIITVTGSKTGRRYCTPVQPLRHGNDWVVLSQRRRSWWRNLTAQPRVELLVQGRTIVGHAVITEEARAHSILSDCLRENPRVAKFYGIATDCTGQIDPAAVTQLLEQVVVILILRDGEGH
jgi:deazaflavin-dependent oxidoreductase (nitroreductase family)